MICVGNPYRRDDGVGLAVLNELTKATQSARTGPNAVATSFDAVEATGEPAALISLWSDHDRVILVDAMSTGAEPGTVHELVCRDGSWTAPPPSSSASTHGLGVAEAVELAKVLNSLPRELRLIGVEVGDCGHGTGLSEPVAAAVPEVVRRVGGL